MYFNKSLLQDILQSFDKQKGSQKIHQELHESSIPKLKKTKGERKVKPEINLNKANFHMSMAL